MTIKNPYHLSPDVDVSPITAEQRKKLRAELKTNLERDHFDRRAQAASDMYAVLEQKRQQLPHKTADWNADERRQRVQETRELYGIAAQSFWAEQRRMHGIARTRKR